MATGVALTTDSAAFARKSKKHNGGCRDRPPCPAIFFLGS